MQAVGLPACPACLAPDFARLAEGVGTASGCRRLMLTLQATTNTDFQAQMAARLATLPPASDPPTPEDEAAREAVLAQFYRDWQVGNRDRMNKWVKAWWSDIWTDIKLQARVYVTRALRR